MAISTQNPLAVPDTNHGHFVETDEGLSVETQTAGRIWIIIALTLQLYNLSNNIQLSSITTLTTLPTLKTITTTLQLYNVPTFQQPLQQLQPIPLHFSYINLTFAPQLIKLFTL